MEYKNIVTGLLERLAGFKQERPWAGQKCQLLGIVSQINDVICQLKSDVLRRARQEILIDADIDIDYLEMSDRVLQAELPQYPEACPQCGLLSDSLQSTDLSERLDSDLYDTLLRVMTDVDGMSMDQIASLANESLGELAHVMTEIDQQLKRHHSDDEYIRLYEAEKRRYMNSGSAYRARLTVEEWKEYQCYGDPGLEDIDDYFMDRLVTMFQEGVLAPKMEHIQRSRRYPGEFDFDQLDDDNEYKRTGYKYYAALRNMVDYRDGYLEVMPERVGKYFYAMRHKENAKSLRSSFLKNMHKIAMVQDERRRCLMSMAEAAQRQEEPTDELNYFAPTKHLKMLLSEEWFGMLTTDEKRFNTKWVHSFVDALMASEWRDQIAREWAIKEKRLTLRCMIIGALKDAGVLRGSYNSIARLLDMDDENPATLAKYMGLGKKQPFAEWITGHVNS
jgi:hypothetical protein